MTVHLSDKIYLGGIVTFLRKILDESEIKQFTDWTKTLPGGEIVYDSSFRFKVEVVPTGVGDEVTIIDLITNEKLSIDFNW